MLIDKKIIQNGLFEDLRYLKELHYAQKLQKLKLKGLVGFLKYWNVPYLVHGEMTPSPTLYQVVSSTKIRFDPRNENLVPE